MTHHFTLRIYRDKPGPSPHYDNFPVEVPDEANVLDAIERAWDDIDRTLMFRHACHHASCGSCGLRVNEVEKLPCVTPVTDYPDGATLKIDPMRNFPIITDLAVDAAPLYERTREVGTPIMRQAEPLRENGLRELPDGIADFNRFESCIECGLCLSACPSMAADPFYLGPVALAFAERALAEPRGIDRQSILNLIDDEHGLWRCHSAFECTEVCPSNVDPAGAIMRLKRIVAAEKFKKLFGR
ncbi:MAG TPA: 2Fe-2S iron-sulfur cluster-binding protein [Anaerolineae bacterium]|nr:2Fe-2S iron-sulfur cluster-binding protein [Anaerolineae bacterium]